MKIKITYEDAVNFIKNNMPGVTGVEIDPPLPAPGGLDYIQGLNQALKEYPRYQDRDKIDAIKRMRELVPGLGLAYAKYAVENPDKARECYSRTGKPYLPK